MNVPTRETDETGGADLPGSVDLAIIGGGPAGSCLATLMAERGRRVALLEKSRHPRFHIGESLLPHNMALFERLGVADRVAAIGVRKTGAEFVPDDPRHEGARIGFERALRPRHTHAWQVRRADFDALLFNRAREAGALAFQDARVRDVNFEVDDAAVLSVEHRGRRVPLKAAFVVDASGRDGLLARKFDLRRTNRQHATAALYGHFAGVPRREGERAGDITVYWFDEGWAWMIPLPDDVMSVGAVCNPAYMRRRQGSPADFLDRTLARNPFAAERMRDAERLGRVTATGNYSYRSRALGGRGWLMLGDAYAFVDPVFSSGVLLGMSSACDAVELIEAELDGRPTARLRANYHRRVEKGLKTFSWFIYRFPSPVLRHLFIHRRNILGVERAVISLLAGDVYDNRAVRWRLQVFRFIYMVNALLHWRSAWRARRRRLAIVRAESENAG